MHFKTLMACLALALSTTGTAVFACPAGHDEARMSCAQGTYYDPESNSCKVVSG